MNLARTGTVLITVAATIGACKNDDKQTGDTKVPVAEASKATAESKPSVETTKKEWTGADTARTMQECWAAFNGKNEAKFVGCYAADADFSYVDFAPPMTIEGAEAIAGVVKMWWGAFPDVKGEAQLVLANEHNYAAILLMTQTNTGEAMMPPTGKKTVAFEAQIGSLDAEGKISVDRHVADQATMAHQMGMHPSERAPDSETAWAEKSVVVANNDDKEKANLAFITGLSELIDKQDTDGLLAALADDVSFRYVGDKNSYANKADYEKGMKEYMAMVKITSRDVKSAWAAGDWVFKVSDIGAEMLMDMPGAEGSKGKVVKTTQTEFFMVADDKIKKHWIFENTMQYPIQLGLMDPTKMGGHDAPKK